jgi:predicted RNA-binding Zn ribbon-like protein
MPERWTPPTVGGHLTLDFVNTVAWRLRQEVREELRSYGDWIRWAGHVGLVAPAEARNALRWASRHPDGADAMLVRVVRLREAIYRVLRAHVDHSPPPQRDLALLNEALREASAALQLRPHQSGFLLHCEPSDDSSHALWHVIRSTADLLVSPELQLLRVCAGRDCGWMFLDRSRSQRRRWCMMRDCGNREKARRYYRRHKSD